MRSQKLTKTLTALLIALVTVSVATSATFAETTSKQTGTLEKTNAELAEQMAGKTAEPPKRRPLSYPKGNGLRIVSTGHSSVGPALGTPEQVREQVCQHMEKLKPGGRYIMSTNHSVTDDIPPENYRAMLDADLEFGVYELNPASPGAFSCPASLYCPK